MSNSSSPSWGSAIQWGSPAQSQNGNGQTPSNTTSQSPQQTTLNQIPSLLNQSTYHSPRQPSSPDGFMCSTPRNSSYAGSPYHSRTSDNSYARTFTPQRFHTPASSGHDRGFHHRNNSRNSGQRMFNESRDRSQNPGGSDNINDYIHPSMLEDPWKDLPATPMMKQY